MTFVIKKVYTQYIENGEKKALCYILEKQRDFISRINEHRADWLYDIRGKIYVRLGLIKAEPGKRISTKKLSDIEALLIIWHKPIYNTSSYYYYYGRDNLNIINRKRRGLLSKEISSLDLEFCK